MGRKKHIPGTGAKHAKILAMAGKMFMAENYGGISMDALADAVPVSKRTLYNHFKDKRALFSAVMQDRCRKIFEAFEQAIRQELGFERTLTQIGEQFVDIVFGSDAINIWRVAITESIKFPELGKMFYEAGPKRSLGVLADYFRSIDKKGEMRIPNPDLSASVFLGMLKNNVQTKRILGIQKQVTPKEKKEIILYAVQLFMAGHAKTVHAAKK